MTNEQKQALDKFRALYGEFDDAMLVSADRSGQLHARPMRIAARHQDRLDDLWFVTSLDSGKIDEIQREPRVAVTMADGKRFLSVSGRARVVTDGAKIRDMWKDAWKLWFPDGPESEDIALIQVQARRGEFWDQSFPHGIRFAIEATKAWFNDESIDEPDEPEQHAKVRLG